MADKTKIEKPQQLLVNGAQPDKLMRKVKLSDLGLRMNEVVRAAQEKSTVK
jgi:hypothetical protein